MCNEYNGYSNYQTWNVSLWLDNDQGLHLYFQELAEKLKEDHENDLNLATYELQEIIKDFVNDHNPLIDNADMFSDLIGHAISNVDFYEIAENRFQE
jgi:hypothetical protein